MIGTWWMYFVPQYAPKHYMSQFHPTTPTARSWTRW